MTATNPRRDEDIGQLIGELSRHEAALKAEAEAQKALGERIDRHAKNHIAQIEALRHELEAIVAEQRSQAAEQRAQAERQRKDDEARARGDTALRIGRWFVGIAGPLVCTGVIFLFKGHQEHETRITRHDDAIAEVRDDVDRHERAPMHAGSTQRFSDLNGDMRALQTAVERMDRTLQSIDAQLRRNRR